MGTQQFTQIFAVELLCDKNYHAVAGLDSMMNVTTLESIGAHTLRAGLRLVEDELLPNGEVPNYRLMPDKSWEYCFSPLTSAYVHEALSCFDPLSNWFMPQVLWLLDSRSQIALSRSVSRIRRKIRRFLAWQEECSGGWRFFGLGSGLPVDLETTACASGALLDVGLQDESPSLARRHRIIDRFRRENGSFASPGSRSLEEEDCSSADWIATASAMRYLALCGDEVGLVSHAVEQSLAEKSLPLAFYYVVAGAWRHGNLPGIDRVASAIVTEILERQSKGASPGPLSDALAVVAVLDLDCPEVEMSLVVAPFLASCESPRGRWLEPFADPRCGSPAMTAAFCMMAMARLSIVMQGGVQ